MAEYTSVSSPHRRTGLQKTRDLALIVMALLVSATCAFAIYLGVAAGKALGDAGSPPRLTQQQVQPAPTPSVSTPVVQTLSTDAPTESPAPSESAAPECSIDVAVGGC